MDHNSALDECLGATKEMNRVYAIVASEIRTQTSQVRRLHLLPYIYRVPECLLQPKHGYIDIHRQARVAKQ